MGRAPQLAYLAGRTVRGGTGPDVTIPGRQRIENAVRFGGGLLVVLSKGETATELAQLDPHSAAFRPERVAGVTSLVTSPEDDLAAYAVAADSAISWIESTGTEPRRTLRRAEYGHTTVLGVRGDRVHFRAEGNDYPASQTAYVWNSKTGEVTALKTVRSLQAEHGRDRGRRQHQRCGADLLQCADGPCHRQASLPHLRVLARRLHPTGPSSRARTSAPVEPSRAPPPSTRPAEPYAVSGSGPSS
ncbi:hypothetical protein Kfla_2989 [Kribbella flavida DSM 17836]|uniref:Uncharacterized protein n=1 Tax=Kribbella flavida (strain DSM 17836 / JCM 10339 / NBRC 14399) TaxID=479435 RepID=D2Q1R5_KRIFD|nr:hypothetical protein [Kribbella flavida]ADB32054.1 hypothetical protein Kfla_2989 [Kribbella flavida DSM 17836]